MTVKDAASNSLLMFVAATCVVLVVRATTPTQQSQHAAPATTIAEANSGTGDTSTEAIEDGVVVYYLHSNFRCDTCRTIEAYAKEAVEAGFADELQAGTIQWQVVNYESPGNEHFAADYETVAPNVVLVKFKDGKQVDWKGLPEVWEHTGDKPAFLNFVQSSLRDFLDDRQAVSTERPEAEAMPESTVQDAPRPDLPLPE